LDNPNKNKKDKKMNTIVNKNQAYNLIDVELRSADLYPLYKTIKDFNDYIGKETEDGTHLPAMFLHKFRMDRTDYGLATIATLPYTSIDKNSIETRLKLHTY
jgi:hypothetical protein